MRLHWLVVVALGCQGSRAGDDTPPDPKGWTITVDMSGLDRYVVPETETNWTVRGKATATEGLATVDIGDINGTFADDGAFMQSVAVAQGTTRVPILVRDQAGHERKATRTLMATRFLVDGSHNASAASLVLDDAILAAMSGSIAGQAGTIDVAAEIMMKNVLSQDDRCTTWPVSAQQGVVRVELVEDLGNLWLHITVPSLDVRFGGQCQGLLQTIPIAGRMGGTLHIWSRLTAKPAQESCIDSFAHTLPEVQVAGWQFDVWGVGGPLQNWIVDLFSGEKSAEAKAQIASEVRTRANTMLTEKLANISVFDRTSELTLLDKPVALHLCLGGLEKIGPQLVARIAASAIGPGGDREAPGAPQIDGAALNPAMKELVLDANLVAQLLYASWRNGGLARVASDVDIGIFQILMPQLYERWPDATTAQVAIDAELPPIVRASTTTNDLTIELPDLMVTLSVEGTQILKLNVGLTLVLDLEPSAGKLSPKVIDSKAEVALIDELYDGPDAALEQAVQSQIGGAAAGLLGDSAAIALPDLPGLGAPVDVVPDAGGRFLRIRLQ
ncbi:MAG: hypothetical protein M4D80_36065 [Myxococcota bacterium]|nr:hypothetical protein [Myxococcota bacterium]